MGNPSLRLAGRPLLACLAVFLFTIGIRAALLPVLHVPMPAIHDEFSHLLAGDTYAAGRLSNPPHPFWKHFESFNIIQQPTYASKYQPLQGLVLALGERFFDQPLTGAWFGVWLSAGLMCAAVCWMLQGWTTPGLAFIGAMLAALRIGILSYWMNSYWGGAVPAIGGALVLGAVPRVVLRRQFAHGITWAVGLAILLNSRPYDGLVLALLSAAVILWKCGASSAQLIVPAAAVLIPVAAFTLYFNARVTGKPWELPYQVHERQYAVANNFAWSRDNPEPVYRHAVMRSFWTKINVDQAKGMRANLLSAFLVKLASMYSFFFCFYPLFIPALIWPYPLQTEEERLGGLLLAGGLLSLFPVVGFQYHYAAAILPLIYLRFLQSVDRLRNWRPGSKPLGFALAVALIALIPIQFGHDVRKLFTEGEYAPPMALPYHNVVRQLDALPGRHLVLVRYAPNHNPYQEWVYNRADIDSARIVWAREMSPPEDAPLIQYFHGRSVWLLEPDQSPPKLTHYPIAPALQNVAQKAE
jgi:hypothetical protein